MRNSGWVGTRRWVSLLLLAAMGLGLHLVLPAVRAEDQVVPTAPSGAVEALAAHVESAFDGTAVVSDVLATGGGRFWPGTSRTGLDVSRALPAEVVVIRPTDPSWETIVAEWQGLREEERRCLSAVARVPDTSFTARAVQSIAANVEGIGRMLDLLRAETDEEVTETRPLSFLPALGRVGYHGGRWARVRGDRVAFEIALGRHLGMERGTLIREGALGVRGFLGVASDGRTFFVELGRD